MSRDMSSSPPFEVHRAQGQEIPVVVEVPHAGLTIDSLAMATLDAPARCIGMDADLYVDRLYTEAPRLGAHLLVANVSRYVVDLNRGEQDVDGHAVAGGASSNFPHGLIWRRTTEGRPALTGPLTRREFERRLELIYRPYHRALQALLDEKRQRFGFVILLAAHSMPSSGRAGHRDTGNERAAIVPGSRGRTTAHPDVIDAPDRLARARGWSVAHDEPYRGGFTTAHYGQPERHQHAVQVELNRNLYMDERTLEPLPNAFERTRQYCLELVQALGTLALRP